MQPSTTSRAAGCKPIPLDVASSGSAVRTTSASASRTQVSSEGARVRPGGGSNASAAGSQAVTVPPRASISRDEPERQRVAQRRRSRLVRQTGHGDVPAGRRPQRALEPLERDMRMAFVRLEDGGERSGRPQRSPESAERDQIPRQRGARRTRSRAGAVRTATRGDRPGAHPPPRSGRRPRVEASHARSLANAMQRPR